MGIPPIYGNPHMLALSETWGGTLTGHGTWGTLDDQASIFWGGTLFSD